MDTKISQTDREKIEAGIREKYAQVAKSPEGQFKYPTGKNGLEALGYDKNLTDALPIAVASSYCGVGNPFALGKIKPGEHILDIGCGAGVDTILAAMLAGRKGSAIGVDIVSEMIQRAESNLALMDLENVKFQKVSGDSLPFAEDTFDVVISNGVINLIPDKKAAMSEIIMVLKPAGRLMVADQIAAVNIKNDIKERLANWFQ
ncbi:MAG: methyltransferase domain-containing protein [Desulfobacterales bacterium]|jgi:arsenite methyltransferase